MNLNFIWSHPRESNSRHPDYESGALPTELGWPEDFYYTKVGALCHTRWHFGQKWVPLWVTTIRWISVPHALHGSPSRP